MYKIDVFVLLIIKCNVISSTWLLFIQFSFSMYYCCTNKDVTYTHTSRPVVCCSYVTVWDCRRGVVSKRLRNERDVGAVAVGAGARRVVLGRTAGGGLRLWEPGRRRAVRKLRGGPAGAATRCRVGSVIRLVNDDAFAVVFAGDVSVWHLDSATLVATFTPDLATRCFNVALGGRVAVFGLPDRTDVVTLRLALPAGGAWEEARRWFAGDGEGEERGKGGEGRRVEGGE